MKTICSIIAVVILAVLTMYFIRKLVEMTRNLITLFQTSKNPNHPQRAESSEVVLNQQTKKLENCSGVIKLPF